MHNKADGRREEEIVNSGHELVTKDRREEEARLILGI